MKSLFTAVVLQLAIIGTTTAQSKKSFRAILTQENGKFAQALIVGATAKKIRYKTSSRSTKTIDAARSAFASIIFVKPSSFVDGLELFNAGDYETARGEFASYRQVSEMVADFPGNYHTLSAFYEMESSRMLEDYEALSKSLETFKPTFLVNPDHKRQVSLYVMWNALNAKKWDELLKLSEEQMKSNLPPYQQVQVAYCRGVALEKKKKPTEAIQAYATVITADASASRELAAKAAYNTLKIYSKDEMILDAIPLWGTPDEQKNGLPHLRLKQAIQLHKLYKDILGGTKELKGAAAPFAKLKLPEPEKKP